MKYNHNTSFFVYMGEGDIIFQQKEIAIYFKCKWVLLALMLTFKDWCCVIFRFSVSTCCSIYLGKGFSFSIHIAFWGIQDPPPLPGTEGHATLQESDAILLWRPSKLGNFLPGHLSGNTTSAASAAASSSSNNSSCRHYLLRAYMLQTCEHVKPFTYII